MKFLFVQDQRGSTEHVISKKFLNVGTERTHDIQVESGKKGLLFSLIQSPEGVSLVPGDVELKLNAKNLRSGGQIKNLDVLEWKDGKATLVDIQSLPTSVLPPSSTRAVQVLEKMAQNLPNPGSFRWNLNFMLDFILESSGAENASLLWESPSHSGWELLAYRSGVDKNDIPNPKSLISQTVLKQALEQQKPVVAESLIGHPWSGALSLVQSKIFSVACIPLQLENKMVGAIFLSTHSPGKSIRQESLEDLKSLTLVSTLLVVTQNQLQKLLPAPGAIRHRPDQLIGSGPKMRELRARIEKLAPTPLSLLILGETGSGKEVVARSLHAHSERREKNFVAINCAAIPEALLESTLFGHTKGAFTGAVKSQSGKFQLAHQGTLFLDEIGDLPLALQAKLLRVLQEKIVEPVGSHQGQAVDVRVIAATHVDLEKAVADGKFRQDLLFRLKGAVLQLPPLRERVEDIPLLIEHFLRSSGSSKTFSPDALDKLSRSRWPGNVRELEQVLLRSVFLSSREVLGAEDIEIDAAPSNGGQVDLESEFFRGPLKAVQKSFTTRYVQRVLESNQGNRSQTALDLGISERTLYRMLEEALADSGD